MQVRKHLDDTYEPVATTAVEVLLSRVRLGASNYDADCADKKFVNDGSSTLTKPSTTATSDLDGDGACDHYAYISSIAEQYAAGRDDLAEATANSLRMNASYIASRCPSSGASSAWEG